MTFERSSRQIEAAKDRSKALQARATALRGMMRGEAAALENFDCALSYQEKMAMVMMVGLR
jgi:hypothetical protein